MYAAKFLLMLCLTVTPIGCGCGGNEELWDYSSENPAPWCRAAWLIENTPNGYTISAVDLDTGTKTNLQHDYQGGMNALGYSQVDQRMYGVDWSTASTDSLPLLRLTMEVNPIRVERFDIPIPTALQGLVRPGSYVGDVSTDGFLYLHAGSVSLRDGSGLVRVDVNPFSLGYLKDMEFIPFIGTDITSPNHNVVQYGDWAFSPIDGLVYVLAFAGRSTTHLWQINPLTGLTIDLGETAITTTGRFGGVYMVGQYTYWLHNGTGEIWRMDLSDPISAPATAELVSLGDPSSANDGAHCSGGS